jgi:hypothetical protein
MKKLLTLLLLATLLLTACNTPAAPIDSETTETIKTIAPPTGVESTTPEDKETTTPEDVESTTPQESESDTTEQIPPKDLLTEFPEVPERCSWSWILDTVSRFQNKSLDELSSCDYINIGWKLPNPFSGGFPGDAMAPTLYRTQVPEGINLPIENITITDNNMRLCIVYKLLNSDTNQSVYYYQIYERGDTTSNIYVTQEAYIATQSLRYSDFSELKIGDPIEKAALIEPQIGWMWYNSYKPYNTILLEDGVLEISFDNQSDDAENPVWVVSNIQFYPNGTDAEINGQKLSILKAENRPPLPGADD